MSTLHNAVGASEITFERMRADIARILHEDPQEIGGEDSLIDLGLDSIRAMALVTRWREQGVDLAFSELAEVPTLSHWWGLAESALLRRAPSGPAK